ncbi:MAG: penicillin-binding protein 2 [Lachnospiraceae bacterium]|nr:penicillin-binding protein 2 [Lachnospiraceae bacterium]
MKDGSSKKQKTASTVKSYIFVSYLFVALFVGMIAYVIYFQVKVSPELAESPYNRHQGTYSTTVIRGSILASNGMELAYTQTDEEGNETRYYPYGHFFAQTVGYADYGSSGLEAAYNDALLDSHTSIMEQIENDMAAEKYYGDNVVTSLDINLTQAAYNALGGRKGAVIVMDADTSRVLTCLSQPDFDPNTVADDWEDLITNESDSPFLNRAIQGLYEPGSTFKILTTLAYLKQHPNDWSDFSYECTGEYKIGNFTIHCIDNSVHGKLTLADAFSKSCNCAFSYMATNLLPENALMETAEELGFNKEIGLRLPSSISEFDLEKTRDDSITAQTSIGQGDTMATPMQMAMIAQAVYNNGEMLRPEFVIGISNAESVTISETKTASLGKVMTSGQAKVLKQLMREVVEKGTAGALAEIPCNACGKTGTAEYDNDQGYAHSWFVGFSNTGEDDIVVAVIVEESVPGDGAAVGVAREILKYRFEQ